MLCTVGESNCKQDEIESALAAENARLREELTRTRQQPPTVIIQQSAQVLLYIQASIYVGCLINSTVQLYHVWFFAQTKEVVQAKERLGLLNKLEKAEARVQTLEAQVRNEILFYRFCFIGLLKSLVTFSFMIYYILRFSLQLLQMEENSKVWGRQKQEMLTTLSEQRHGFLHRTILHNVSSVRWLQLVFTSYTAHTTHN